MPKLLSSLLYYLFLYPNRDVLSAIIIKKAMSAGISPSSLSMDDFGFFMVYAGTRRLHEKRLDLRAFPLKIVQTQNFPFKFLMRELNLKEVPKGSSRSQKLVPVAETDENMTSNMISPPSVPQMNFRSVGRILRSGILEKLSKDGIRWKPRYVVLVEDGLWYSKAPINDAPMEQQTGGLAALWRVRKLHTNTNAANSTSNQVNSGSTQFSPNPLNSSSFNSQSGKAGMSSFSLSNRTNRSMFNSSSTLQQNRTNYNNNSNSQNAITASRTLVPLVDVRKVTNNPDDSRVILLSALSRDFVLRSKSVRDSDGWLLDIAKQTAELKEALLVSQAESIIRSSEILRADSQLELLHQFRELTGVVHCPEALRVFTDYLLHLRDFGQPNLWLPGITFEDVRSFLTVEASGVPKHKLQSAGLSNFAKEAVEVAISDDLFEGERVRQIRAWLSTVVFPRFIVDALSQRRLAHIPVLVRGYGTRSAIQSLDSLIS